MSPSLRFVALLVCSLLAFAALVGGPGTGGLFSDIDVAAGNVSADVGGDTVSTVEAINETDDSSVNTDETAEVNETDTATVSDENETSTDDADGT